MVHFGNFVLRLCLPVWTLVVSVRTVRTVRMEVTAQPQVVGSSQPIVASLGDDIILPCHLEPRFNVERLTVEWSRPDLKPDPSDPLGRVDYVLLYRDRKEVLDMQIGSYASRAALFPERLKDGNVSLRISNVTLADGGRYRCFIPKLQSAVKASVLQLVVKPPSWTTETPRDLQSPEPTDGPDSTGRPGPTVWIPVVLVLVLVLGAGLAAYFFKNKCHKQKTPKSDSAETKPLSA